MKRAIIISLLLLFYSHMTSAESAEKTLKKFGVALTNSLISQKSKYSEDSCYFGMNWIELKEGVTVLELSDYLSNSGIVLGDVIYENNQKPYLYIDDALNKLSSLKYPSKAEFNVYNPVDGFRTIVIECAFSRGELWKDIEPFRKYLSIARGENIITEANFLIEKYGASAYYYHVLANAHKKFAKASKSDKGKKLSASEQYLIAEAGVNNWKQRLLAHRFTNDSSKYRIISAAKKAASSLQKLNQYSLSRGLSTTIDKISKLEVKTTQSPAPGDTKEPPQKEVTNFTQSGTCFFISQDKALTNYHVVEDAAEIKIIDSLDKDIAASILKKDKANDLALLKFDSKPPAIINFSQLGSLKQGMKLLALGFPLTSILGKEVKITDGIVSSLSGISDESHLFQMTNPLQPGNSGGPVITESGELVGVSVSTADAKQFFDLTGHIPQNINWAIKSDYASVFSGVYPMKTKNLNRDAAIKNAIAATCKVATK